MLLIEQDGVVIKVRLLGELEPLLRQRARLAVVDIDTDAALTSRYAARIPVLVLDDSLSAVDTGTEALILRALKERKGRQTTVIIAHRLSSVMHADRILVLEHGRCVQLGTHEELAAQPGSYRRLCEIQGALDAQIRSDMQADAGGSQHVR